ncbi:MAG TPA: exo-alpha-sialidase [Pirellulales bacterium]|nr:exo-alpha-sialidase [Pirellulales bacterium]
MRLAWYTLLLVLTTFSVTAPSRALDIGQSPGKVALTTLAGDTIEMENYAERPATAVLFISSRCPATVQAIADIDKLYARFRHRGVLVVGVAANAVESDDELRTFAQRRGLIFPVYRDRDGAVTKQFAATMTPEVFLLDKRGALAFHGSLGDEKRRAAYEAAVLAVLRKQPVATAQGPLAGTPLATIGEQRDFDDPYGTISFSSELVFEKIPAAPAHHCSTICEAANHDLLCLWYGGTYESAHDQTLFLARKKPGEKNWSAPQALIPGGPQPPGNGVIFRDPADDRIWIVWCRMEGTRPMGRGQGWDRCRLFYRTSTDHGVTWSEDRPMFDETLWCVPRNPPVALGDGTLLLPVEGLEDEVEGSHFLVHKPGAARWERAGFTSGGSQPAVIERNDGSLLAMLRHARFITHIESRDAGQTWSKAEPTPLQNPDSGITMTKLANGHLLLVYNDSQTKRTPLAIVRSLDEGKTWEKPLSLECNPGEYSYPCIIQTADGKIHVTYTFRRYAIKHAEFNEDWLTNFERPD